MKLACVQAPVEFANPMANAAYACDRLRELAADGVEFAIFPEAFLTGYAVDDRPSADAIAIDFDHGAVQMVGTAARNLGVTTIVGFAGRRGQDLVNAVAIFDGDRPTRFYLKTHLPYLGFDRFATAGDRIESFETRHGRVGALICFDMRPPEASRELALQGAELIALPTNWPRGAESSAQHICIARAAENRVAFATCNRVGHENGFEFIGLSKIIDPNGVVLAAAGAEEQIISAELDLSQSRLKKRVTIPGKYEIDVFACRNSSLYPTVSRPTQNPS